MRQASSSAEGGDTSLQRLGRVVSLGGVVAVLLLIGGLKFTTVEVNALEPMISYTPWLAWLYPVFGKAGASHILGVVEITAGVLLLASPWYRPAAIAGGILSCVILAVTCSLMVSMPIWEAASGGFPALSGIGSFLIKDVAMLGICLSVVGQAWKS